MVSERAVVGPRITGHQHAKLLAGLAGRTDIGSVRTLAVVRLIHDAAVRLGELVAVDVADLDCRRGTLALPARDGEWKVRMVLPPATREAVAAWLPIRARLREGVRPLKGDQALFVRLHGAPVRLSREAIFRIVARAGEAVGVKASPLDLRLLGVHEALLATDGDVLTVAEWARMRPGQLLQHETAALDARSRIAWLVAGDGED